MTFLKSEALGGVVLMLAAAMALALANSFAAPLYFGLLHTQLGDRDLLHWINEGLMALFFLLVGLEIKREIVEGELRGWKRLALPGLAAVGGMVVPAGFYLAINWQSPNTLHGWAIPTATDIAFSLGVLALLGSRIPPTLKVFLTALAIIDDLGAVAIIGIFYTSDIALPFIGLSLLTIAALVVLNRRGVTLLWPYLLLGALLWGFTLQSGIHATLAGVALAFTVPLQTANRATAAPPLSRLEHRLAPWVGFGIVPLFGFANAGVALGGFRLDDLLQPIPLGIAAGLFFGKQIGVFAVAFLAVQFKLGELPRQVSWASLYGAALLCGIGFTISLFIGGLAFGDAQAQDLAKVGVLAGSLASALLGWAALRAAPPVR